MATAPLHALEPKRLSAQRLYRNLGWSVIPVDCTSTEIGANGAIKYKKIPHVPWLPYTRRAADESEIAEWARRFPNTGIGVVCGAVSGLLVLDADGAAGVAEVRKRGIPKTPTVATPSGGLHAYFKAIPGVHFKNGAKLGDSRRLDVRSDGGYVVAPYSKRPDGKRYEWLEHPERVQLAEPPEWFLKLLNATPNHREPLSVKLSADSGVRLTADRQGFTDGWIRKLPDALQRLVFDGGQGHYKTRHGRDYEVVLLLLCVGAPLDVIEEIFESYPIGDNYQESDRGSRYLERTISAALASVKTVRIKYADAREYDIGACGHRIHLALEVAGESGFLRMGVTAPTPNCSERIALRWQGLFQACRVRVPGLPRADIEQAARNLVGKRMRIMVDSDESRRTHTSVVGFYPY